MKVAVKKVLLIALLLTALTGLMMHPAAKPIAAQQQQVTGAPGSPEATTTIEGGSRR